jgi:hypothetical protein
MRAFIVAVALIQFALPAVTLADASTASKTVAYSTADTDIGTILDTPALRAIVDKHLPGFSSGDQIDMARSMTLKAIQQFAADTITDKALADIDAEFAKVSASKK